VGGTASHDIEPPRAGRTHFWHLREDDQRLLFITIVGGLAANVGLVLIVGLGLAVIQVIHRYPKVIPYFKGWAVIIVLLNVGNTLVWIGRSKLNSRQRADRAISLVALGLLCAITILALIGYAAGIK
jgi:hypothetical protein